MKLIWNKRRRALDKLLMKITATVLICLGFIMELINVFSLLNVPFDDSKGIDDLIGQYLFNIILGIVGIILIVVGIRSAKK